MCGVVSEPTEKILVDGAMGEFVLSERAFPRLPNK
jgi:hypothetical protein